MPGDQRYTSALYAGVRDQMINAQRACLFGLGEGIALQPVSAEQHQPQHQNIFIIVSQPVEKSNSVQSVNADRAGTMALLSCTCDSWVFTINC